jgi:translation initiation factor IF-1
MSDPTDYKGASRSQATGTKLGKGARRALGKNADCIKEYIQLVSGARTSTELTDSMEEEAFTLARVTRATGGGRLEVHLQDGTEGVSVPISGTMKFKGRASTKADRANCMCAGDVIIIRGSFASAKLTPGYASVVKRKFEKLGITTPSGFFTSVGSGDTEEDAFEFERTEDKKEEQEEQEETTEDIDIDAL